jgi:hypothetical protein
MDALWHRIYKRQGIPGRLPFPASHAGHQSCSRRHRAARGDGNHAAQRYAVDFQTYTDAGLLPVADAVLKLPSLTHKRTADSQIDSQDLFRAGQDQSSKGTDSTVGYYSELPSSESDGQEKVCPVKTSQKIGDGARYRV